NRVPDQPLERLSDLLHARAAAIELKDVHAEELTWLEANRTESHTRVVDEDALPINRPYGDRNVVLDNVEELRLLFERSHALVRGAVPQRAVDLPGRRCPPRHA